MEPETGLWGLLLSGFLASTLLPGGSEAALIYAQYQQLATPLTLWTLVTLGNTLGGLTSWGLGWWLRFRFPEKHLSRPKYNKALSAIRRYGSPLLLFSWLPLVGDPLCLAAGWAGIGIARSALFIGIGKGLRYAVLLLTIA